MNQNIAEQTIEQMPPDILSLTALAPKVVDGKMHSPKLASLVTEYATQEGLMWDTFEQMDSDTLAEQREGRRLAEYYLLKTALKSQQTDTDQALWAERFSEHSDQLYGYLELGQVQTIASEEAAVNFAPVNSLFREVYELSSVQVGNSDKPSSAEQFNEISEALQEALSDYFKPIVDVISVLPEKTYTPSEVREVFSSIFLALKDKDIAWDGWTVTNPENKTMLSVVAGKQQVEVPDGRSDISSRIELLSLAMHEIGVHAQRAVNGKKIAPNELDKGLSGYIDFEEGLGVLFEVAANGGKVPNKIKDRYMDIALAKGLVGDRVFTRYEIVQIGIERAVARNLENGSAEPDLDKIYKEVFDHVNRIFRGGTGEIKSLANGKQVQAIYSKDSVYYGGYLQALAYVNQQVKSGVAMRDIIDFLLQGKFDATNPEHVAYVKDKLSK